MAFRFTRLEAISMSDARTTFFLVELRP